MGKSVVIGEVDEMGNLVETTIRDIMEAELEVEETNEEKKHCNCSIILESIKENIMAHKTHRCIVSFHDGKMVIIVMTKNSSGGLESLTFEFDEVEVCPICGYPLKK